jgi:hypothetical protein
VPTGPRTNRQIRVPEVRLVDDNGQQVGVMPIEEALQRAEEAGLDLIEVAASAVPPVCRIADLGKFRFEQDKRAREAKKASAHLGGQGGAPEAQDRRARPAGARTSRASLPGRPAQGESRGALSDAERDTHPVHGRSS